MHPHAALLTRFYDAFARRDGAAMAACYHPEAWFRDPAFGELRGEQVGAMWRMLTARASDLDVRVESLQADEVDGEVRWVARYAFGKERRPVVNRVRGRFEFEDGLIRAHEDSFSLWRWSAQALGPVGALLGWSPIVRARVRRQARAGLDAFLAAEKAPR